MGVEPPYVERARERVGTVVKGKYRLERILGVGGMAAVYLGVHRNGNRVAVKVLHAELSSHADLRRRFAREGYAANAIGHRGAVRVLDDDVAEDGSAFLVMELLEGETLEQQRRRRGGTLPHREVLALGYELLDVLAAAHDKGVVHRDIKPENLFLASSGTLKVLDFGVARFRSPSEAAATWTGSLLGTPGFMPPEQAIGRASEIDARSDVWAAGATLFTLLSGQIVHQTATPGEVLVHAATRPARSLAEAAPSVPAPIIALVDRALQFSRADRWPSARAMGEAIAEAYLALHGQPIDARGPLPQTSPTPQIEAPPPPPRASRSRGVRATGVALTVALLAGVVALAGRATSPRLPAAAATAHPSASASPGACSSNAACMVASGGRPAICRRDDGACVPLESADCRVLAQPSDLESDATLWLGAMFPVSESQPTDFGPRAGNAVELARRDFARTTGGLPPARPGGPRRPIAVVLCDDRLEPERAARHLVEDLRVPAVLGFARSKEVLDLADALFVPQGVLALASNTASMLRTIPHPPGEPRLVWRVTTSAELTQPATAALLPDVVEPELRAAHGVLQPGEPIRVAVVRLDNASGRSHADLFARLLRWNGKSAAENDAFLRQVVVADGPDGPPQAELVRAAGEIAAFRPHVVLQAATPATYIPAIEAAWPAREHFRPRHILGELPTEPALLDFLRASPEVGRRILGVDVSMSNPAFVAFVRRYNQELLPLITTEDMDFAPYDGFYLAAYAAAALGDRPITGKALAGALTRLGPPGERVDVGPAGIEPTFRALAAGKNVDLEGVATALDFDPETGDPSATLSVYCFGPPGPGGAPRLIESGLLFRAGAQRPEGVLRCP